MSSVLRDLRQRKIVQWALAYLAAAWLLLQVVSVIGMNFGWPPSVLRGVTVVLLAGFPITLVLAWYHGEKGQQRATGPELLMIAALLVLAAVALAWVRREESGTAAGRVRTAAADLTNVPTAAARGSIAVLPFANLSGDPEQEFFSDGMTDEIISHLAKVEDLKVISRTSVMRYKETRKSLREIARELGVATVLEGSVRREGHQVRVTAQLIDAATDAHLWSESYDREVESVFAIQSDVATSIARALELELSPDQRQRIARAPTSSPEGYQLYLRGRYFWNRRTPADLDRAMELFREAVARDPEFALAHVAIAETYILLPDYADVPAEEAYPAAKAAARRALEIEPSSGEAWLALATVENATGADLEDVGELYERAIELAPGYATARQWYAEYLVGVGRIDEAVRQAERAHALDPQSPIITAIVAMTYYYDRRYEEAIAYGRAARDMNANIPPPHAVLAFACAKLGRYPEAIDGMVGLTASLMGPEHAASVRETLTRAWRAEGESGYWREIAALMSASEAPRGIAAIPMVRLGNHDEALDLLEQAVEEGSARGIQLSLFNPEFDVLRGDPRFERLLERVRVP